ncbi:hypothetical protein [Sphingomonas sanxanigenens]|uniref:Lipoprotein n=1 Tax=Sphingomonas sanxanigenens DSM 19645 = NX02 TaxID=1123269 RepID=W0A8F1_9SPHN|nr:hypothetical protein [Sphingomonas sanxanigenens]AHE52588.1 hypothetical protein NX02_04200 [Sphingomonas sanxanigenens DSM 19645 = NX02]
MRRLMNRTAALAGLSLLAGCSSTPPPAVAVRTVEVVREVQRPCPVTPPPRPAPLDRPLLADAAALAALLGARLAEWAGPGGYGERADAALMLCTGGR